MTLQNRQATNAYIHALNNMAKTRPGLLASIADRMSGQAFDRDAARADKMKPISSDAMMCIETAIFCAMCDANDVDWRLLTD